MSVKVRDTLNELYHAVPEAVPEIRAQVVDFAADAGARPAVVDAVRLAVSEAVTNVVVHAYPEEPGDIHVTAAVAGDELWILIADDGCGHQSPPRTPGPGWGLALITKCAEHCLITERAGGGTEIRMRFPVRAPLAA